MILLLLMDGRHKKAKHFLHHNLFGDVSSFSELEKRIENLVSNQDRGDAFEVFAQAYLATQQIVQAKAVWTFDDIPQKIKSSISIDTHIDMGVDGVFEMSTGEQCAYQVKFRSGRPSLTWTELSTFMGLTEQVDKRVLFTNCDDIPDLMNDRSDFYCIRGSDLDRLGSDDFDAINAWLSDSEVELKHFAPKPHQKDALEAIHNEFHDADRATVVMACGTGKTLVQLWAAEMLNVKSVLVLLPSLALVRQTLHEWLKQTKWEHYSYLCVCSDSSVKGSDEVIVKQSELDFPVTTNGAEVARYLHTDTKGPHVVFSTYQSAQVVSDGVPSDFAFDLGVFDEAHKTAGREGTKFSFALSDDNLRIRKRLFMTATPRHYDVRKKDKEGDSKLVYSMDVSEIYGDTAYSLQFRQAVNEDLICDYKVLISVVTNAEIDDWQLSHGEVVVQGDAINARQVANQIALKNAVDEYGVRRIFTFHASVASAESFTSPRGQGINSELPSFVTVHVNGAMSAAKRSNIMREFAEANQAVISNARCLTEGVDVPAVDMVAFLSPKKSKVDIVQATGRAMRKSGTKEVGYVLIPLYLEQEKGESLEDALERTDFDEIWNVLQAMKEQDDDLADVIREIQEVRGKTGGYNDCRLREHLEILGPTLSLGTLRNSLITQCIEQLGDNWDEKYGELQAFKEAFGHCNVPAKYQDNKQLGIWVSGQRYKYKLNNLEEMHVQRLEHLGFTWDINETIWNERFAELKEFKKIHGHCIVPITYKENKQLGIWVASQRKAKKQKYSPQGIKFSKKQGVLSHEHESQLNKIGFVWDPDSKVWEMRFKEFQEFKKLHGHCLIPVNYPENQQLKSWVINQRIKYKQGKMSEAQVCRLKDIGFLFDKFGSDWEARFNELQEFKKLYGHCNVPQRYTVFPKLGIWLNKQRLDKKRGKVTLTAEKVSRLDKLGFIWDPLESAWDDRFNKLKAFKEKYGHCNAQKRDQENRELGIWVATQRKAKKSDKIDNKHVNLLDALGFSWEPYDDTWDRRFSELQEFKKVHGHCNVPRSYPVNPQLDLWIRRQRNYLGQDKLEAEKVQRLEELGFVWEVKKTHWEDNFSELKIYKNAHGHCNVPLGYAGDPQLATWVYVQREKYRQGKLHVKFVRRLKTIGFFRL